MKQKFREFYKPSQKEISDIWTNGIFIVDTNVLLDLYRYSKETREKLLNILKIVGDKLWLPYWIGYEFHQNRMSVIEEQWRVYDSIKESLDGIIHNLEQHKKHPTLKIDAICQKLKTLKTNISNQKRSHSEWYNSDGILDEITKIFDGKIGDPYDETRLSEIAKIGAERYKKNIPPGYIDAKKILHDPSGLRAYGDLIIWFQIIDKVKESKKPIIFITEDGKKDWWNEEILGKKLGPRVELVAELYKNAKVMLLMYDTGKFIEEAAKRFSSPVESKTIKEIKQLKSFSLPTNDDVVAGDLVTGPVAGTTSLASSDSSTDNNTGGTI